MPADKRIGGHRWSYHPTRFPSSPIATQKRSHAFPVINNGSPSRIRSVLRISFGMTTLPSSSILRTIPVARKFFILLDSTAGVADESLHLITAAVPFFFASLLWDFRPQLSLENLPANVQAGRSVRSASSLIFPFLHCVVFMNHSANPTPIGQLQIYSLSRLSYNFKYCVCIPMILVVE